MKTDLTSDEKRLLVLAIGIVSMEQAISSGTLQDNILRKMEERVDKSKDEYTARMGRIDYPSLIKRLEAIE